MDSRSGTRNNHFRLRHLSHSPFLFFAHRGRAGQPGPRAENRERAETETRWNSATECRLVPLLKIHHKIA
jgi:hypothetical protein